MLNFVFSYDGHFGRGDPPSPMVYGILILPCWGSQRATVLLHWLSRTSPIQHPGCAF